MKILICSCEEENGGHNFGREHPTTTLTFPLHTSTPTHQSRKPQNRRSRRKTKKLNIKPTKNRKKRKTEEARTVTDKNLNYNYEN